LRFGLASAARPGGRERLPHIIECGAVGVARGAGDLVGSFVDIHRFCGRGDFGSLL